MSTPNKKNNSPTMTEELLGIKAPATVESPVEDTTYQMAQTDKYTDPGVADLTNEVLYPGPKLTKETLRENTVEHLRLPSGGHPDYAYRWLSMDAKAVPNFYDAVGNGGYTACTITELPEMEPYCYNTIDSSITKNKIMYKEMILCKIHKADLQLILERDHHDKPMQMARDVYRKFDDAISNGQFGKLVRRATDPEVRAYDEERNFVNGMMQADPQATGIITNGKDVKRVRPKFQIE
jgi:hypothetical protein